MGTGPMDVRVMGGESYSKEPGQARVRCHRQLATGSLGGHVDAAILLFLKEALPWLQLH